MNDISAIAQKLDDLKYRAYGNGQPGDIQTLYGRTKDNADKIRVLEEFRWKAVGVFSAIVVVAQFLMGGGSISLKTLLGH